MPEGVVRGVERGERGASAARCAWLAGLVSVAACAGAGPEVAAITIPPAPALPSAVAAASGAPGRAAPAVGVRELAGKFAGTWTSKMRFEPREQEGFVRFTLTRAGAVDGSLH